MAYKYKLKPKPVDTAKNRLRVTAEAENLAGVVNGQEASEIEERFAKALRGKGLDFSFQVVLPTGYQIPGQLNTIDFVIYEGVGYPVEIDGDWVHKNASQRDRDLIRDAIINAQMTPRGWMPIMRVPGYKLETQEDADKTVEEMF